MARSKSISLSLGMPDPVPASSNSARSASSNESFHSGSAQSMKKEEEQFFDATDESKGEVRGENGVFQSNYTLASIKSGHSIAESASPTSPSFTSLPPFPTSPGATPKHARDPSKFFFSNLKASKSSTKIQPPTIRQVPSDTRENTSQRSHSEASPEEMRKMTSRIGLNRTANSEIAATASNGLINTTEQTNSQPSQESVTIADSASAKDNPEDSSSTRSKAKLGGFLKRSPSLSIDRTGRRKPTLPPQINVTQSNSRSKETRTPEGPLTAPLQQEQNLSFHDIRPAPRNRSADRDPSPHSDRGEYRALPLRNESRDGSRGHSNSASQVFRGETSTHGPGIQFFSGIKNTTSRAAEGLGKAGNRLMGKIHKSNGNLNKDKIDEYVPHTIRLPLVEQTRKTRIAKRLEDSKDKTEFWMPALPWRCIDYLNFKGCDEEGLYRVPGSTKDIRLWTKRFDQEYDINLFDADDLYDINIIGSLFKEWLRELPDEIFPKDTQERLSESHPDPNTAPQELKDELSMLPPWNYYLLFAITCHLSLLHAYVEKNKMTFNNLRICFAPALKMNPVCFQWLVCDWRNCWQGCWTEKEALEEEYRIMDGTPREDSIIDDAAQDRSFVSGTDPDQYEHSQVSQEEYDNHDSLYEASEQGSQNKAITQLPSVDHNRTANQLPELALLMPISPSFVSTSGA
ncbi:MAG: hypothetical protein MMC33_000666 [Icmadophila ericetorum]|nr:hypothetical protein [Icmadophila ericetorum]